MRYAFLLLSAAALVACSSGEPRGDEVRATGGGTTRSFPVAGFTGVTLTGSDDVDVRVGTAFSVRAEGPPKELDALRIARDGDTLTIGRRDGVRIGWHGRNDAVKVYVTMPRLAAAALTGSGTMAVDRVEGGRFAAKLTGSGDLNVAALAVDDAALSITGSGNLRAGGTTGMLAVSSTGSGGLDAAGLRARQADVTVMGSGDVRAAVEGPARVKLMGSGDVNLGANARCDTQKMGSGSVRCGR